MGIGIKKREGDLWNHMYLQTVFRFTGHGEEHIINLEGFGQILDDAKKEFIPFAQHWVAIKGRKVDWKETCRRMELVNIEREKWFNKWFGEATGGDAAVT